MTKIAILHGYTGIVAFNYAAVRFPAEKSILVDAYGNIMLVHL